MNNSAAGICQRVVVALGGSGSITDGFHLAHVTVASSSPAASSLPNTRKFIFNSWLCGTRSSATLYPEDTAAYEIIIRGNGLSIPPPQ